MTFAQMQLEHPKLSNTNSVPTSDEDEEYNCFAWAAGDVKRWWSPIQRYYWPIVRRELSLSCFVEAYATLGYSPMKWWDHFLQWNLEKVAIYVNQIGEPAHMARQMRDGKWTSKLGVDIDISHESLSTLEDNDYGKVAMILRRKR